MRDREKRMDHEREWGTDNIFENGERRIEN